MTRRRNNVLLMYPYADLEVMTTHQKLTSHRVNLFIHRHHLRAKK